MFGAKFPPPAPMAMPLAPGWAPPPGYAVRPMVMPVAPMAPVAPVAPMAPVAPVAPQPAPQGKDVLLMIRQGVAKQDRAAVKQALQVAHQLQTSIEPSILDMLKKWLGDEAFNAAMGREPPAAAAAASSTPAKSAPEPSPRGPKVAEKPPLVLIREGVAAQNKEAVRSALRTAVEQNTQIDAPVLEMLRKWLGEDDEALKTLANRKGLLLPKEPAIAQSTGKAPPASAPAPASAGATTLPPKSAPTPKTLMPGPAVEATGLQEAKAKGPPAVPPVAVPVVVPPRAPKAAPQPVIRRGPVLKNAEKPPDLDASFDAFLQELDTAPPAPPAPAEPPKAPSPEPETPEPEAKRRKVEAEPDPTSPSSAKEEKEPPQRKQASPSPSPPAPKPDPARPGEIRRPAMRKPPEPKITKDEWGRDVVPESSEQEKEAWQYLQEARAAAQTSVWGAGNFIDFNSFK